MAAELVTPVDELTGIPLPLMPYDILPANQPEIANWNHAWHPSSAPELQSIGGHALRNSRLQLVLATDHNMYSRTTGRPTYHDLYKGPELITDEVKQFKICVLSAAGYIPDRAIDLHGGSDGPRVLAMADWQKDILRMPAYIKPVRQLELDRFALSAARAYRQQVNPSLTKNAYVKETVNDYIAAREQQAGFACHHVVYRYEPLRDFFKHRALNQDLRHLKDAKIEEFLLTSDPERKLHLGRWLLAEAVDVTTEPVSADYQQLYAQGRLHPAMPADARQLVLHKLGRRADRSALAAEHEATLRANLGLAA